ncbi:hypothetical protein B0H14DRAFT_1326073 [Mycena olivaceomarginata]|nr:hypothetical protein B0H14DRAFT_1326073 [Mycena olivaceomarginata]
MHLEFDEAILASPSIPPRSKSSVSLASTASSSFPRSSLVATVMSSIAPSRDWKFGAPAIVAGRSTRGDCTCAGPACGAPDDVGLKVVEMAGAPRLPFLGICTGIFPARAACVCERLRAPGTDRGVLAFYVVARYSVMVFRVRAGKRSVRHLIVEGSMRGRFCCGGSATSSDSRGAQRLEVEGCPSPMMKFML